MKKSSPQRRGDAEKTKFIFVVRRGFNYMTRSGGWSATREFAWEFPNKAAAQKILRKRIGFICARKPFSASPRLCGKST